MLNKLNKMFGEKHFHHMEYNWIVYFHFVLLSIESIQTKCLTHFEAIGFDMAMRKWISEHIVESNAANHRIYKIAGKLHISSKFTQSLPASLSLLDCLSLSGLRRCLFASADASKHSHGMAHSYKWLYTYCTSIIRNHWTFNGNSIPT